MQNFVSAAVHELSYNREKNFETMLITILPSLLRAVIHEIELMLMRRATASI